ncbi:uncharacterized protein LOC126373475 [Pectinophora gossypiella]|uniref:uncharacterized protein LOC126373475 n=1 Tax=Pectinophora gossypiella TaxID=13191 RepID=UPI00214EA1B2|nr:uncharacterized protein LOC126373475 [Pectinophora gossypiella]
MATKRPSKKVHEANNVRSMEALPDVALAAIASYRKQKEVSDFINFMLEALERNSNWLNNVVGKQTHFRCALLTGSGPNRFQIQEIIYPSDNQDIKLEVELNDSEDHDKVALAALLKLSNADMDNLLKYIKTRIYDNAMLREDLLKGKAMGISFAVLRPFTDKQYRVMERIVIGSNMKCVEPKKRRREDKSLAETILRKTRRKT